MAASAKLPARAGGVSCACRLARVRLNTFGRPKRAAVVIHAALHLLVMPADCGWGDVRCFPEKPPATRTGNAAPKLTSAT